jgi:LuxR family maltose regulon positive regulatory protein
MPLDERKLPLAPPLTSSSELLSTKLAIPQSRLDHVPREALLARLDEGLRGQFKLSLVLAPAGFGKTSLVSAWIAVQHATSAPPAVAWVSLDSGDSDPVRFWRYVISACQAFGIQTENALARLHTSQPPVFEAALTALINALAQLQDRAVLVLEDYHFITDNRTHETLAFLIEHLPASLHVVLTTRSEPALPLARMRARQQLNELRPADLQFSIDETRAFLEQTVPLPLSPEAVERLAARTEGWVAGLRLVALALQGLETPAALEQFVNSFGGSHRPILEYLATEVLAGQPAPVQDFLLQTSGLGRLSARLCDAVLKDDPLAGAGGARIAAQDEKGTSPSSLLPSAFILEHLEHGNLFLVPLDTSGTWYRYHALFAEAMQHQAVLRLGQARLREISRRVSEWYEQQGLLAEAVEAALAAGEPERVAQLIDRIVGPRLVHNEYHTLRRWMEQLPLAVLQPYPRLCLTYAIAILFTSDRTAPETHARLKEPLEMAEQAWRAAGDEPMLGQALAFRARATWLQGRLSEAFALARQALELLAEENIQGRGITLVLVGAEEVFAGRLNAARQALSQARALCVAADNIFGTLDSMLLLGQVCTGQGALHEAAEFFRQVLAETEYAPMEWALARVRWGRALVGLAALNLEWNELDSAAEQAAQALDIRHEHADEELRVHSAIILAGVEQARGQLDEAHQRLQSLGAEIGQPSLLREVRAAQARLALALGDLAGVRRWSAALAEEGGATPLLLQEQEAAIALRLLVAEGDAEAALQSIEARLPEAHADGRGRSVIELQILIALAYLAQDASARAQAALSQALRLAQPEGFRRLFLDEWRALAGPLRALIPVFEDEALATYARALLYEMGRARPEPRATAPAGSELLAEPLSPQEARILRLLAAGLSNPEIAQELVVSVNTVKTHVKSIYVKLNVRTRQQAREAARLLKLA